MSTPPPRPLRSAHSSPCRRPAVNHAPAASPPPPRPTLAGPLAARGGIPARAPHFRVLSTAPQWPPPPRAVGRRKCHAPAQPPPPCHTGGQPAAWPTPATHARRPRT
ncbi:unnamed protein product [Dicrocoelium dendriticum]|nr:unnamed protein product [Dicrocoelium dendriticum]